VINFDSFDIDTGTLHTQPIPGNQSLGPKPCLNVRCRSSNKNATGTVDKDEIMIMIVTKNDKWGRN